MVMVKQLLETHLLNTIEDIKHSQQVLENNRLSKIRAEDQLKRQVEYSEQLQEALKELS